MIEVTTQQDATVEVHVLESGMMECLVGGTLLWPTPEWLCRAVAIQTGVQELSGSAPGYQSNPCGETTRDGCTIKTGPTQEQLYSVGARALSEAAPVCLVLSFDMLQKNGPNAG